MKKFIVTIISALMICMCLAACGSDTSIKSATEASQGSTAATPKTTTAATSKSDENDDGMDAGVIVDNESGANDAQVE